MTRSGLIVLAAALTTRLALAQPAPEAAIRETRKQYDAAVAQRDLAALAKLTTAEFQMTGPVWRTTGIGALQSALQQLVGKRPDLAWVNEIVAVGVREEANVASERGRWHETWTERGSPVDMRGSYLAMWKRVDGKWLLDAYLFVPQVCKGDTYCKR